MVKSGIYQILNTVTNMCYIGSAINIKLRWNDHKHLLRQNKHPSKYLQYSWNKYGENIFRFSILEMVIDKINLIKREQIWINYFECVAPKGYNLKPIAGSPLGYKATEETKLKMSLKRKGFKHTEITKYKCHINNLGKKRSLETRMKKRKPDKWPHELGCFCKCKDCMNIRRVYDRKRNPYRNRNRKIEFILIENAGV